MELNGKIIQVLPLQSGEGKNGPWKKQDFIIETIESQYPKKVCIAVWGDKIDNGIIKEGNEVKVSFDIESREYNSRWYTDVKAWKLDLLNSDGNSQGNEIEKEINQTYEETEIPDSFTADENDDLPF